MKNWILLLSFVLHVVRNMYRVYTVVDRSDSIPSKLAKMPPVSSRTALPKGASINQKAFERIALWSSFPFLKLKGRRCLYSSMQILSWARAHGLRPVLNIGVGQMNADTTGHCWLSVDGSLFCDSTGLPDDYPQKLSDGHGVVYWAGENGTCARVETGPGES